MIAPDRHDPRPGAPGPLVARRDLCLFHAHVALERIYHAERLHEQALAAGHLDVAEAAETVILEARARYGEWIA